MAKTMAADKNNLRAILRESRQALGPQCAQALSAKVQSRLIESAFYRSAPAVVLYAAVENEVATDLIAADSIRVGRPVYYPRVDPALRSISIAAIRDPGELRPGPFGIPEPPADREIVPEAVRAGSAGGRAGLRARRCLQPRRRPARARRRILRSDAGAARRRGSHGRAGLFISASGFSSRDAARPACQFRRYRVHRSFDCQ